MEINMMEKVHAIDKAQGILFTRVDGLEKSEGFLWKTIDEFRESIAEIQNEFQKSITGIQSDLNRVKVDVAKVAVVVGIAQVIATGIIVWALTKGKGEPHAAGQIHQTEEPYLVDGIGDGLNPRR